MDIPGLSTAKPVAESNQGLQELATALDTETKVGSAGTDKVDEKLDALIGGNLADITDEIGFDDESTQVIEDYAEVAYKHRTIAQFKVGPFHFKNHILVIAGPAVEVARKDSQFKHLWRGLMPVDKNNIKRVKNVQNEVDVDRDDLIPRSVRGPVDTGEIADRQAGDRLTPQTPKPGAKPAFAARTLPFQNR